MNIPYTVIYQETNPYLTHTAFLEDDGRTIYLYLQPEYNQEMPIQSVWVKNLIQAPLVQSEEDLQNGLAPLMCKDEVIENMSFDSISADDIELVWTEQGDGVALFVKNELYAFLPSWSGINNFFGYSKFALKEGLTAYPLGEAYSGFIADRIESSRRFWKFRFQPDSTAIILNHRMNYFESLFGQHIKYWSKNITQKFPVVGVSKFCPSKANDIIVYTTIGMSGQSMPKVELYHRDYERYSKAELLFAIPSSMETELEEYCTTILEELSRFPWEHSVWIGEGHKIRIENQLPSKLNFNFITLASVNNFEIAGFQFPKFTSEDDELIQLFIIMLITENEQKFISENKILTFIQKMKEKNLNWIFDPNRDEIC